MSFSGFFDVSALQESRKKFFRFSDFCFQLPSLLVDFCKYSIQINTFFTIVAHRLYRFNGEIYIHHNRQITRKMLYLG